MLSPTFSNSNKLMTWKVNSFSVQHMLSVVYIFTASLFSLHISFIPPDRGTAFSLMKYSCPTDGTGTSVSEQLKLMLYYLLSTLVILWTIIISIASCLVSLVISLQKGNWMIYPLYCGSSRWTLIIKSIKLDFWGGMKELS